LTIIPDGHEPSIDAGHRSEQTYGTPQARLPPLQDGELVAQEQDLGCLPRFLTPGQPQP
jgi:hypothetical protein